MIAPVNTSPVETSLTKSGLAQASLPKQSMTSPEVLFLTPNALVEFNALSQDEGPIRRRQSPLSS